MEELLHQFILILRRSGVRISLAEGLDAFETARHVGFTDREMFRDSLAAVLAKTLSEKEIFMDCFDRFFDFSLPSMPPAKPAVSLDSSDGMNPALSAMLMSNDQAGLAAAMSMAATAENLSGLRFFTQKNIYALRILDRLGIRAVDAQIQGLAAAGTPGSQEQGAALREARDRLATNVRNYVARQYNLVSRPVRNEFDEEYLMHAKLNYLEQNHYQKMHAIIMRLVKQLNDRSSRRRKAARRGMLDFKKTLRQNVSHQGLLFDICWKRKKIDRPEVVVICDVSRSVQRVVRFLLLFLYSLNKTVMDIRSFVFCSDLTEVTDIFRQYPVEEAVVRLSSAKDIPILMGRTDYNCAFRNFQDQYPDAVGRRTTVLILGDARNNYNEADTWIIKTVRRRCKRLIWINPETPAYWGTGDSEMKKYAPYCNMVRECNTLEHLERLVSSLLRAH